MAAPDEDPARMASFGATSIRILMIWSQEGSGVLDFRKPFAYERHKSNA
jgi:hypothetical protein